MDSTTVVGGTPERPYIFDRGYSCEKDDLHDELAAWGRSNASEIGHAKFDVASMIGRGQLANMEAVARGEAATADRLAQAARDTTAHTSFTDSTSPARPRPSCTRS